MSNYEKNKIVFFTGSLRGAPAEYYPHAWSAFFSTVLQCVSFLSASDRAGAIVPALTPTYYMPAQMNKNTLLKAVEKSISLCDRVIVVKSMFAKHTDTFLTEEVALCYHAAKNISYIETHPDAVEDFKKYLLSKNRRPSRKYDCIGDAIE